MRHIIIRITINTPANTTTSIAGIRIGITTDAFISILNDGVILYITNMI